MDLIFCIFLKKICDVKTIKQEYYYQYVYKMFYSQKYNLDFLLIINFFSFFKLFELPCPDFSFISNKFQK